MSVGVVLLCLCCRRDCFAFASRMAVCEREVKRWVRASVHGCVRKRDYTRTCASVRERGSILCKCEWIGERIWWWGWGCGCVRKRVCACPSAHLAVSISTHITVFLSLRATNGWVNSKKIHTHRNAPSLAALYTDYRAAAAEAVYLNDLKDPLHAARATSSDLNLCKRAQRVVELELGMIVSVARRQERALVFTVLEMCLQNFRHCIRNVPPNISYTYCFGTCA